MKTIYLITNIKPAIALKQAFSICQKEQIDKNSITIFDYIETGLNPILEDVNTYSMFSSKKATIIVNATFLEEKTSDEIKKDFLNYLNNPSEENILIIINEKVDDRKKMVTTLKKVANIIDNSEMSFNYKKTFEGYQISDDAIAVLRELTSNDPTFLEQEAIKLKTYALESKIITKEDVSLLVSKKFNENDEVLFQFVEALMQKNTRLAINLFEELQINNFDNMSILGLIGSQIHLMYQVKALSDDNFTPPQIATSLSVHPYRIKKVKELIYQYTLKELEDLLINIANIDLDVKSGKMEITRALNLLILKEKH